MSPAATTRSFILLQDHELELAKRRKDCLEVVLSDREVNVADKEAMERDAIGLGRSAARSAGLVVLVGFCVLHDDGNSEEFLPRQFKRLRD